jgi:hypothetical protein
MASRIIPHPEAFAVGGKGQRHQRQHKESHLDFIRKLSCLACRRRMNVEAAHIRFSDPAYGKRETGTREKSHDHFTLPLCTKHHMIQHTENERLFWEGIGIRDPLCLALILYSLSGNVDDAESVIQIWWMGR